MHGTANPKATLFNALVLDMAVPSANTLLPLLRKLFDNGTRELARACAAGSSLDSQALDLHQGPCFELAWASADLQAAEQLAAVLHLLPQAQTRLGLAFIAEAVASVITRLQQIHLDLGLDGQALDDFAVSPELAELRRCAMTSTLLARLGQQIIDAPEMLSLRTTEDGIALARDTFERFASEMVAPMAQKIHRDDLTVPESLLQPLRELGVFGLSIPQEFGGSASGGSHDAALMIAVTEALSEASLSAAGSLITRPEILARALLVGGTHEQKQKWLPRISSGELLCSIAITEPDHGSDVAGLTLAATPAPGGWQLQGSKTWCTFAGKAQLIMVVCRTHKDRSLGHRGLSVILVEKPSFEGHSFQCSSPGGGTLSGWAIPTIGYRGMHSFDLAFDGFMVPEANLIGGQAGIGKGFYYTMAGMTGGRLQTSGRACGVMRAAIKAAIGHSLDRRVFGAPLASYPLTQIKIARMAARYLACRQLAEATAHAADKEAGSAVRAIEASLAKLLSCRSAELVTREALQIFGGMGYAEETVVSRLFVDARVLSIFEGAEETLALKVIARGLLEAALASS